MRKRLIPAILLALAVTGFLPGSTYNIVIGNGRIVDGSGNPWYVGDIGIRGGRIAAVGALGLPGPCDAKGQ